MVDLSEDLDKRIGAPTKGAELFVFFRHILTKKE